MKKSQVCSEEEIETNEKLGTKCFHILHGQIRVGQV